METRHLATRRWSVIVETCATEQTRNFRGSDVASSVIHRFPAALWNVLPCFKIANSTKEVFPGLCEKGLFVFLSCREDSSERHVILGHSRLQTRWTSLAPHRYIHFSLCAKTATCQKTKTVSCCSHPAAPTRKRRKRHGRKQLLPPLFQEVQVNNKL